MKSQNYQLKFKDMLMVFQHHLKFRKYQLKSTIPKTTRKEKKTLARNEISENRTIPKFSCTITHGNKTVNHVYSRSRD